MQIFIIIVLIVLITDRITRFLFIKGNDTGNKHLVKAYRIFRIIEIYRTTNGISIIFFKLFGFTFIPFTIYNNLIFGIIWNIKDTSLDICGLNIIFRVYIPFIKVEVKGNK